MVLDIITNYSVIPRDMILSRVAKLSPTLRLPATFRSLIATRRYSMPLKGFTAVEDIPKRHF